jgi:SAM-dependent methyltransferase
MQEKEKITDIRSYWLNRGKYYSNEFKRHNFFKRRLFSKQEKILLRTLKTIEFESVLEIGCGFGRITKLILDNFAGVRKYKGIDMSPEQIKNCERLVAGREKVELSVGTVQELEEDDNSYDMVIAVEVLMHIPFSEIALALSRMKAIASKYIVNLDWYRPIPVESLGYCFAHDYGSIYESLGILHIDTISIPRASTYSISFGLEDGLKLLRITNEMQKIWVARK